MDIRRDAMAGFCEMAFAAIDTATAGDARRRRRKRVLVSPNLTAAIPSTITFSLDARHPDPERCTAQGYARGDHAGGRAPAKSGLRMGDRARSPGGAERSGDRRGAGLFRRTQGVPFMKMASGAGHDSQQMAAVARVAMVFVRSKDGRSHTPDEFSSLEDIVDGIRVLAGGLHELAY